MSILDQIAHALREGMVGREFTLIMNLPKDEEVEKLEIVITGALLQKGSSRACVECDSQVLLSVYTMGNGDLVTMPEPGTYTIGKRKLIDEIRSRIKKPRAQV